MNSEEIQRLADNVAEATGRLYDCLSTKGFNPEACLEIMLAATPMLVQVMMPGGVDLNEVSQPGLNGPGFASGLDARARREKRKDGTR